MMSSTFRETVLGGLKKEEADQKILKCMVGRICTCAGNALMDSRHAQ